MISNVAKAHLSFFTVNVIYGANYLIAKGLMPQKLNPEALTFVRITGGMFLFVFIKFWVKESVAKKDIPRLAICALLGVAGNQYTSMKGLSLTSPVDGAIIVTAIPIFTSIISYFVLKEMLTLQKTLGILIGGIGAVLLIYLGNQSIGSGSLTGNLVFAFNALEFATYLVLVKPLMDRYRPITVISWLFAFGFLWMFPFLISSAADADFSIFANSDWMALSYTIIGPSFLAFLLNMYGLQFVRPTVSSSYIYVQPAVTMLLVAVVGYFVVDSQYKGDITVIKIVCCVLIIAGVYLIGKKSIRKR